MSKIKITQTKSAIHRPKYQKATIEALGIKKLNHSVVKDVNPQILGMVKVVSHLVTVENI